jgi:hypothetical protein
MLPKAVMLEPEQFLAESIIPEGMFLFLFIGS